jgi:hypothetical protein
MKSIIISLVHHSAQFPERSMEAGISMAIATMLSWLMGNPPDLL